ncbi:MAG: NUDIX domain-containing protein [Patescibacteria group bacterium]
MQDDPRKTPEVFVAAVIFQLIDNELTVLLTQRQRDPFNGLWALPGGLVPLKETLLQATTRILHEKTAVKLNQLGVVEQLYTFDTFAGNPNGPTVSVMHLGLGKDIVPKATPLSRHSQFYLLKDVPELAFDHSTKIDFALQRLRSKLSYTNAIFALLPTLFTMSQLQTAYEAVLGKKLDKRNFRKKFISLGLIQQTSEYHMSGAHRPARLYKFNSQTLEYLTRSFD